MKWPYTEVWIGLAIICFVWYNYGIDKLAAAAAVAPFLPQFTFRKSQQQEVRYTSLSPVAVTASTQDKKVTLQTLRGMYKRGDPITILTAYDFPSRHVADAAGMYMVLLGDSLAMVTLGLKDTSRSPVVRHVSGFRVQGKSTAVVLQVLRDLQAVQEAGASMIVVGAVSPEIAAIVTKKLRVLMMIGIGAGNRCSRQVLEIDMLNNYSLGQFLPKSAK
ncbi:3-methyl-2-oxobutanoate hydroxymethyltransferase PanB [Aspergillus tubingensis]|uniref:3-methyl-2-oxobutanoate hydroxymethyltransferase n=1 Tax=Aspergillus niger TaxID=5061 RepID=A0A124BZ26_ASPNG|nr:3-methyl-2-oxobutanoate hydroxymethyltransferase PanB [Aspergillus tubingensis]GAQ47406.1 probable ketopantoate hydroxymethyltransferase [Aspergillus niger]GFN11419.1 3-methyl-2-oxobutanoate hydroxymethyltransferase PanB [Aspergillus tubingensis]